MEYGTYTAQTVGEAVELVNLFVDGVSEDDAIRAVLHLHGLAAGDLDQDGFADLAAGLRRVFEASDESTRAEALNRLIERYEPRPRLTDHDGQGPHFHYAPDDGPDLPRVGASLTMSLANVVVDFGGARLGCCGAPSCRRVFVDATRNRSQRFCSKRCANRVHVAEHRARA
ncbi:MAG: CGNR zinc finger domain-containing protein [Nitriliruptorales bacterium]|nr:CGNR zinc finger domain-containing protein [Nitriliruptorales bacterium]